MSEPKTTPNQAADGTAEATAEAADRVLTDLEDLRTRLQAAEQARDQYLDLATRTKADFENYQKRVQRDLATERRYAQAPLAADLLGALDNMERATAAARQAGETGPLVQGVAMVHSQLLDVLRRHGISRMDALGQPFDPTRHEAVMQKPTKDFPPMTVVDVLEQGYTIHDRVLRPARVAVSTAPAAGEQPPPPDGGRKG
jgi:molecular chaperone GrpE